MPNRRMNINEPGRFQSRKYTIKMNQSFSKTKGESYAEKKKTRYKTQHDSIDVMFKTRQNQTLLFMDAYTGGKNLKKSKEITTIKIRIVTSSGGTHDQEGYIKHYQDTRTVLPPGIWSLYACSTAIRYNVHTTLSLMHLPISILCFLT